MHHNFAGNRSVRSLERDQMRIVSIWTIRNYDIIWRGNEYVEHIRKGAYGHLSFNTRMLNTGKGVII